MKVLLEKYNFIMILHKKKKCLQILKLSISRFFPSGKQTLKGRLNYANQGAQYKNPKSRTN
jgi:hypothetical protein